MERFFENVEKNNIQIFPYDKITFHNKIGEGGFGEVHKCEIDDKMYASKRLYFEFDENLNKFLFTLLNELKVCKNLKSKRFTHVYGVSYDNNGQELYIIMEYLNNGSLYDYLKKNTFSVKNKLKIFYSIILSVKEFHKQGYIHTDLKPENLSYFYDIKEKKKYIKLFDYNLVAKINKNEEYTDGWDGTYGYSAPEQFNGIICKKSDIYGLGVIFLEILMGCDLWDPKFYNYQKSRKSIIDNLESYKNININIYKIIKKCLSMSPENRISMQELQKSIKNLINNCD